MTSPFPLPVLFTAWEWHNGAGIAGQVIKNARLGGFETVAVELSEDTGGDPGSTLDVQDVKYLKDAGLFVAGWGPVDGNTARQAAELGVDGWLPQVEGPGQRDALISLLKSGSAPKLPWGIVTTYGGLDTAADVHRLVDSWPVPLVLVECYKADGSPHNDISRMLSQGVVYGFLPGQLRAVVGTYRGELPADYPGLTSANYGGAYLEEPMTSAQLSAFGQIVPADVQPTPEPTVTNDAAERNDKIAALADEWLKNFGPAPLSRLHAILSIAESTDAEWNAARQYVVEALNGTAAKKDAELQAATAKIKAAKTALG